MKGIGKLSCKYPISLLYLNLDCLDVQTRVGTLNMNICLDVITRMGTPQIIMFSDVNSRVVTLQMFTLRMGKCI